MNLRGAVLERNAGCIERLSCLKEPATTPATISVAITRKNVLACRIITPSIGVWSRCYRIDVEQ